MSQQLTVCELPMPDSYFNLSGDILLVTHNILIYYNKEARRLYAELKSLMMSLYGFPRLWCHNRGFPSKKQGIPKSFIKRLWCHNRAFPAKIRESPKSFIKRLWYHNRGFPAKIREFPKVSLRDYDVITGFPARIRESPKNFIKILWQTFNNTFAVSTYSLLVSKVISEHI